MLQCKPRFKHQHELQPMGTGSEGDQSVKAALQARREKQKAVQLHMQLLLHASSCRTNPCSVSVVYTVWYKVT